MAKTNNKFIYIITFTLINLLMLTLSVSATNYTVQYSTDNSTWYDAESVDQTNCKATQEYLDDNSDVYWRVKQPSSAFATISDKTKLVFDDTMIGVSIILITAMVVFIILGIFFQGLGAKLFFFGIAFMQLLLLLFASFNDGLTDSLKNLLELNFTFMVIIIFSMGLFAIIKYMMQKINPQEEEQEQEDFKWRGR
jgi:hypothetical protein